MPARWRYPTHKRVAPGASSPSGRRELTYYRNSLDLKDKVQVKVLRRGLKLSDVPFASIVERSGAHLPAVMLTGAFIVQ